MRPDLSELAVVWLAITLEGRQVWKYELATGDAAIVAVLRDTVPIEPPRIADSLMVWGMG